MGMKKQLMSMSREYLKDPNAQYFKYLKKILDMSLKNGVGKEKVKKFVNDWLKNG